METTGAVPLQPWEDPKFNWVDVHHRDPVASGGKVAAALAEKARDLLLPNADEIREDLVTNYHAPPAGFDTDKPARFLEALGIDRKPVIIFSNDLSPVELTNFLGKRGIPWHGSAAQWSDQIDACLVHTRQIPHGFGLGEVLAHEGAHSRGCLPSQVLNEGIAFVIQELYGRLSEGREAGKASLSPPYSAHKIGLIAVSNLCDADPQLFESMLNVIRGDSPEAHGDFLTRAYDLMGARRFWYITTTYGPKKFFDALPEALRGVIPDALFDSPQVPLDNLLQIVGAKLREYETRTGYRFNFPQTAAYAGAVALRANTSEGDASGSGADDTDDLAGLIDRVTQTMIVDD